MIVKLIGKTIPYSGETGLHFSGHMEARDRASDICAEAASICYNSEPSEKIVKGCIKTGHESVIEHASFIFRIEGVSRALLAQLTRHRIASFSVESQRYVQYEDTPEWIIPPSIMEKGEYTVNGYKEYLDRIFNDYREIVDSGIPAEDARMILPNAMPTNLIMTMNARELRHFLSLRMCNRAQWEIRAMADEMYRILANDEPVLFGDAGCGCMRGSCPEGKRSCGHPRKKEDIL